MYKQEEPCASQLQRGFFYLDRDPFLAYGEDALNSISWDDLRKIDVSLFTED